MKKNLPFDLTPLVHDLIAPVKSLEGLLSLSMHPKTKEEAEEICFRFQHLTKTIDERITRELINIEKGEVTNNFK